jgi:hypothetical protein
LLHQDTRAFGVGSACLPAVSLTHDDDPTDAVLAEASGAPQATGRQPLATSARTLPPAIPTLRSAGRYVMDMKSATDREPSAGRAAVAANHGWQPGSCRR